MAGGLTRGEVRLYRFAPPDKQRPVVILTRTPALRFLGSVVVAPVTSTIRGSPTEVVLGPEDGLKKRCAANLDHVMTVPRTKLGAYVATLSEAKLHEVCVALGFALGCRTPIA